MIAGRLLWKGLGIAARNGIILVSHYRHLRAEGLPREDVIIEGSKDRLAPVLMTALAAALGVLPLVFGDVAGKELERPMAHVILGGLPTSTVLVRWRAVEGAQIRLEFDPHRDAHEVIQRTGEIRATFRRTGEHWYVASIVGDGHQPARGVVVVHGAEGPVSFPPICGPASSDRICVEP